MNKNVDHTWIKNCKSRTVLFWKAPTKNGRHECFWALKVSNICQQMFQNNSEHYNSACHLIWQDNFSSKPRNFHISEVVSTKCLINTSRFVLKTRIILVDLITQREDDWQRNSKILSLFFTNITIFNSEYFVRAFFSSPSTLSCFYKNQFFSVEARFWKFTKVSLKWSSIVLNLSLAYRKVNNSLTVLILWRVL